MRKAIKFSPSSLDVQDFGQNGLRHGLLIFLLFSVFSLIAGNLISLAVLRPSDMKIHLVSPIGVQKSRPDIDLRRHGRGRISPVRGRYRGPDPGRTGPLD